APSAAPPARSPARGMETLPASRRVIGSRFARCQGTSRRKRVVAAAFRLPYEREEGGTPMLESLRTPDDRFVGLPGYPFRPHYLDVDGLRVHYVDDGPPRAHPVLCLHGEPSWSYLYRKMIPVLVAAGHRVVAPDLIGFGRSDKPVRREDYTYQRHVDWMRGVLLGLDLREVTLVAQDWGGLIGLRLATEHPERFARVVAANTFLPTADRPPGDAFL